jgi:Tol biopolymer transport system component
MNPDGSGLVNITDNIGIVDEDPSWSWDNRRIAFRSDRGGQGGPPGQPDIWVMDADGSNPVRITNTPADNQDPAFSPDGSRIVYEEEDPDDGTLEIFIIDLDGSNKTQLTDAPRISEAPSFTRDGSTILFKSDRANNDFDVYTMNADGSNVVALTNAAGDDFDPSYSPDESTIIFSSQRNGLEALFTMNADGSNQQRWVLPVQFYDWHPVYSTDGSQVIFTSDRNSAGTDTDNYELWIVNVDGSGLTRLTNNNRNDDDAEFRKPVP